jgi:hypothetical protein
MTPVVTHGLTLATQEHSLQSYALPIQPSNMPEPNGVNSVLLKVMMTMMMISSTIDCPSIIATQLMKAMTPYSDISYHDNDKHDNLNKPVLCLKGKVIPCLKGKVDLMKKPILHLKGMLDLMKKLISHLKVQMDQALVPVDPSVMDQALEPVDQ